MSGPHLVALDCGTTGIRALVFAADGSVPARAYRPLSTRFPAPGRVEQDPDEFWERGVAVVREALAQARLDAADIAGLGVVTQRSTTIAWDAATGAPLAPALSWQDMRTAPKVAEMRAQGIPITTLASATKFAWWLENEPAVQKAAHAGTLKFGTPDTWLTHRLTGGDAHVTDPGQASCTGLYDPNAGSFAAPLGGLFGVPLEPLPDVVPSSAVVGETPAELFGCPIPVAARAGDQQASAFGQGVHERGQAKLTLGTSAMLDLHTGSEPADPPPAAFPLALWTLADGDRAFCLEGQVVTAGAAVDWAVALGLAADAAALDALASGVTSAEGVVFVPALQGLGSPYGDEHARGLFSGLTRGSGRAQLARAVLEGVAHRVVDILHTFPLGERVLRVDGGLAQSALLLQAIADLGDCTLLLSAETEATAVGAAQLAGLAVGVFESPAACRATLAPPHTTRPALAPAPRDAARARWQRALEAARNEPGASAP